jgi:hypothetical protein
MPNLYNAPDSILSHGECHYTHRGIMSSSAARAAPPDSAMSRSDEHSSDLESNEEAAGQTIGRKRGHDTLDKEDAATQAASENLKHTTISDKDPVEDMETTTETEAGAADAPKGDGKTLKAATPEPSEPTDAQDAEMKEQVSSPKKKRSREQDDEVRDLEATDKDGEPGTAANGSATGGGRTTRLAPEKKRHRDTSVDPTEKSESSKVGKVYIQ